MKTGDPFSLKDKTAYPLSYRIIFIFTNVSVFFPCMICFDSPLYTSPYYANTQLWNIFSYIDHLSHIKENKTLVLKKNVNLG